MTIGAIVMFCLGALVTVTSQFNASLGRRLGVWRATFNFMLTGAVASLGVAFVLHGLPRFAGAGLEPYHALPGLLNVLTVAAVVVLVNRQGAMLTTAGVFTGQVVNGFVLDSLGAFGLPVIQVTAVRSLAAVLLILGVAIVAVPARAQDREASRRGVIGSVGLLGASIALGALNGLLAAINGQLGQAVGTFYTVFLFLAPGAAMLWLRHGRAWRAAATSDAVAMRFEPTFLVPGLMNVVVLSLSYIFLPVTGLQVMVGAKFTANLSSAALVDTFGLFGMPKYRLSPRRLAGLGCLVPGVLLSVLR